MPTARSWSRGGGRTDHAFRYGSAPERQMNLAAPALTQGDEDNARHWLRQVREYAGRSPALFARVGCKDDAKRGLEFLLPSNHSDGIAAVTRGLLALRQGQIEPAAERLREGPDLLRSSNPRTSLLRRHWRPSPIAVATPAAASAC